MRPFLSVLGPAALACALGGLFAPHVLQAPAEKPYRILVTNDDGIEAEGLRTLVAELAKHAEVFVSAPDGNRSGASASIESLGGKPMALADVEMPGAVRACAVGGKPVDACCFGLFGLGKEKPFDLVVSGINQGANVGNVSHYSGTVGAAMSAAHHGVPAIAVSQDVRLRDYVAAARFTGRFVAALRTHGARKGVVYSINVPAGAVAKADAAKASDKSPGVVPARMGGTYVDVTRYTEQAGEDGKKTCKAEIHMDPTGPEGSDTAAYAAGNITVTPLAFDWTDEAALTDLAGWDLTIE